jgi:hypothetical protein
MSESKEWQLSREERFAALSLALTAAAALLAVLVFRIPRSDFGHWVEALAAVGTLTISLLAYGAAVWWWLHRASGSPRLRLTQSIDILPTQGDATTLYITAHLENVGEVPIILTKWRLWATGVHPLPQAIDSTLDKNPERACRDFRQPWEAAAGQEFVIPDEEAPHVLPGETQDLGAILRVSSAAQVVRIYSHFPHESLARQGKSRGWSNTTLIRLKEL